MSVSTTQDSSDTTAASSGVRRSTRFRSDSGPPSEARSSAPAARGKRISRQSAMRDVLEDDEISDDEPGLDYCDSPRQGRHVTPMTQFDPPPPDLEGRDPAPDPHLRSPPTSPAKTRAIPFSPQRIPHIIPRASAQQSPARPSSRPFHQLSPGAAEGHLRTGNFSTPSTFHGATFLPAPPVGLDASGVQAPPSEALSAPPPGHSAPSAAFSGNLPPPGPLGHPAPSAAVSGTFPVPPAPTMPDPSQLPGLTGDSFTFSRAELFALLQRFGSGLAAQVIPPDGVPLPSSHPSNPPLLLAINLTPASPSPGHSGQTTLPLYAGGPSSSIVTSLAPITSSSGIAPSTSLATRPLLAAPPAAMTELDPNIMPIPLRVQRIFNAGWSAYVPLDTLTTAACHRALTATNRQGDSSLSLSSAGEIQVSNSRFDQSKERLLTAFEFMQASSTLVWVIRNCLKAGPEGQIGGPTAHAIADCFQIHYERIQRRQDFGENFQVYLAYDIFLRHAYLQSQGNLRMDVWHRLVFERKFNDHMQDRIHRSMGLQSDLLFSDAAPSSTSSSSSSSSGSSTPSNQSFRESEASSNNGRKSNSSNRGKRRSTYNAGSRSTNKTTRCMVCGDSDHRFTSCTKTGHILRKVDGRYADSDGTTYCFAFNGPNSCSASDCPHRHACSLCAGGQHSAQNCAAQ